MAWLDTRSVEPDTTRLPALLVPVSAGLFCALIGLFLGLF
jgi:hypothetical protein